MKNFLATLTALALVLVLVPATALAEEAAQPVIDAPQSSSLAVTETPVSVVQIGDMLLTDAPEACNPPECNTAADCGAGRKCRAKCCVP